MNKKLFAKLLAIVSAVAILATLFVQNIGLFASAQAPALPGNSVVVLDQSVHESKLGTGTDMRYGRLAELHNRENAGNADFTKALIVEFDIEIGDYANLTARLKKQNIAIKFVLASGANRSSDSAEAPLDISAMTHLYDNWYHAEIPISSFVGANGTVDWSSIKHWAVAGSGNKAMGNLYSMDFNVANVCGTSSRPKLPENVLVVIDEEGTNNTLGNSETVGQFTWLQDRVNKFLEAPVDISLADCVEFDVNISKYDELLSAMDKNKVTLYFNMSSKEKDLYNSRSSVPDILRFVEDLGDNWYHFTIPVEAFTGYGGLDFSSVWSWCFYFEGTGRPNTLGSIYNCTFNAINICATEYIPDTPDNSVAVIDKEGQEALFGADFSVALSKEVSSVDASKATRVDFDFKASDFDKLEAAMLANSLDVGLELYSGDAKATASAGEVFKYAEASYGSWYHASVLKSLFAAEEAFDWADVTGWKLAFIGDTSASSGDLAGGGIKLINLCGAVAPRPDMSKYAGLPIDEKGISGTLAPSADTTWGELKDYYKSTAKLSVDYSGSVYVEFDIEIEDIERLKAILEQNGVTAEFSVSSDSTFKTAATAKLSLDNLTNVDDNWYHASIHIPEFSDNGVAWDKLTSWKLSFITDNADVKIGDDYAMGFKIANICSLERPKLPENTVLVLDEEGSTRSLAGGANWPWYYLNNTHGKVGLGPYDLSEVKYIEFDLEVGDFTALAAALAEKGMAFTFRLVSTDTMWDKCAQIDNIFNFTEHTYKNWYHVRMPVENFRNQEGILDWENVRSWLLYSGSSDKSSIGDIYSMDFNIANICATEYESKPIVSPEIPSDNVYIMDQIGVKGTLGDGLYSKHTDISDTFTARSLINGKALQAKYIAFHMYVENKKYLPSDLGISFATENEGYLKPVEIDDQILENGWNEIVISLKDLAVEDSAELNKITSWKLTSSDENTLGASYSTVIWLRNFIGIVVADAPDMPENTVAILNYRGKVATPGAFFSYFQDRMWLTSDKTTDFSNADFVELDLYVSDLEALKKSYEENAEDVTSLIFCIASGDPEKYGNPRYFNRVMYDVLDELTQSGWNHIKIPIHKMIETGEGPIDWTQVRSFMMAMSGPNSAVPTGDCENIEFKLINICGTRVRPLINITPDEDKPYRPDDDAVYISDAEDLFDDNGTWNPIAVKVSSDYKTEGFASVMNEFTEQPLRSNQLRYLFNETADVSDIKTLKFDLFIKDIALLREKAAMSVLLSNDSRGTKNYKAWKLDLSSLKDGWNAIEIDVSKGFVTNGKLDLAALKAFIVQCDTASFSSSEYIEKVTVGLDNVRYISKTGNTELKINFDDDFSEDLGDIDYEFNMDSDFDTDEDTELENTNPGGKPATQIIKTNVTNTVIQYAWLIFALAAEAVLVAAVVTILSLIKRKKNKTQN